MKINGLMDNDKISWKKIPCCCDKSNPEKCHPISRHCKHCCCQQAEDSMPREDFTVKELDVGEDGQPVVDADGNVTGAVHDKLIKEITIKRSTDGYDSIIGWSF
jgi:hypothetical protein